MFHSDGHFRVEKSESDENKVKRQDSLDRFLRDLKPIKAPQDESLKSENFDSLMPPVVGSSQEYYDPVEQGQQRRLQPNWRPSMEYQDARLNQTLPRLSKHLRAMA